ncbi:uncharacterized protein LOC143580430 [Bidens hawaiensis]|uniref:uncharacterized protein LOC143580430 n=1 Tax=Bidens hawaiensis TaxID=980011 RepID=UPI00404A1880
MTNCFEDDNQLIDPYTEDDNLLAFHSLEDVRVSDTDDQRKQSLGWDCGFFTSAGLLNPEELSKVNKGFKKSNPATRKDAKRPTKIGYCNCKIISYNYYNSSEIYLDIVFSY